MTNTDNFDADVETGGDEEFGDAPAEEASAAPAAEPKKSGGGGIVVKLLVLLIVLAGGAAGAVKMGFVALPFDIPGLTPPASVAAAPAHETPASKPPVEMAQADKNVAQPATGPDASPPTPQPAMNNIAPQSGEAAPAPGANPMLPAPVTAASQAPAPPEEIKAPAAPKAAPPAAPADVAAAPALTAPPSIAAPSISAPEMPAVTPPAAPPAMTAPPAAEIAPPAEAVAPPAVGNPEDAAKMQKLDDRVTALEQKIAEIADMKGSLATKADLDALKSSLQAGMSAQAKNPGAVQAAGADVARHRHGKAPRVVKTTAVAAGTGMAATPHAHMHGHHKGAAPMMTSTSNWILKGAKPGTAWVAEPGSAEIRAVGVGETLKGLGKITSISQDSGGRWVVSGTRGRINQ